MTATSKDELPKASVIETSKVWQVWLFAQATARSKQKQHPATGAAKTRVDNGTGSDYSSGNGSSESDIESSRHSDSSTGGDIECTNSGGDASGTSKGNIADPDCQSEGGGASRPLIFAEHDYRTEMVFEVFDEAGLCAGSDQDGTWRPATLLVHKEKEFPVIWFGADEFEGLCGKYTYTGHALCDPDGDTVRWRHGAWWNNGDEDLCTVCFAKRDFTAGFTQIKSATDLGSSAAAYKTADGSLAAECDRCSSSLLFE
jgi:hypothetical protein